MTQKKESQEPSMNEILSSIRQLIATESDRPSASVVLEKSEDILDLTNLLPDEACSSGKGKSKRPASEDKKGMRLPAWAENIKMPFPMEYKKEDKGGARKDELFLSRSAAEETAQALQTLTTLAQKEKDLSASLKENVETHAIENQLREILKPLLKEWLDNNLPLLVRWVVSEQVEKLIQHYGLAPQAKGK